MTSATWAASAQAAINAVRAVKANNLILVPSTYRHYANNFVQLNANDMIGITDPGDNFSFEVHQYVDYDGSGTHTDYLRASDSAATLSGFTAWLLANHRTGLLGEIGVTSASGALADLAAMLQYMHSNPAVWTSLTYWSAGPWWQNSTFGVEPVNGTDTLQMTSVVANLGGTAVASAPATSTSTTAGSTSSSTPTSSSTTKTTTTIRPRKQHHTRTVRVSAKAHTAPRRRHARAAGRQGPVPAQQPHNPLLPRQDGGS